jgi:hypothetical protein
MPMLATLRDATDRAAIEARLAKITPEHQGRWGRMTAPQMICHLTDSFKSVLGERTSTRPPRPAPLVGRTVLKWANMLTPIPWPHGLRTAAMVDPERGGTPPAEFERDVAELRAAIERFVRELPAMSKRSHFVFGKLTEWEWARWAWRHMNHHLRQFGE